jgi:hypothetical protein
MISDALASESSKQDAADLGVSESQPAPIGAEAAMQALSIYDRMFFLRVAHSNAAQASLLKSSATKLAESQKLLGEISVLLRG